MQALIPLMIVDDERLAIEDLSTIVDWNAYGFEIVATAFNGAQAFTKFMQLRPQLVITDIKMPIMDGIELIRRIREVDRQVPLLLLTAYADFSYARTAIQLGITDYIIKSEITAQNMAALLTKLRGSIEQQRQNRSILTGTMLEAFFAAPASPGPADAQTMLGKLYAFLILERDEPLPLDGGAAQSEGGMKQAELRQLLREHRYEELQFASSCALSHRRTLLVLKTPDNSTFHTYDLMRRNALRLQAALAERTAGATTLYLTMRPMNFYEFRRFLQNNPDVFERKYFLPEDALILLERVPPRSAPVPRLDRPAFEALLDAGDADGAEAFVRQLYAALTDCADLRALLSCSQELYFALAHRAEALPEHTAWNTPDDRAQWRSAACIGRWLTEKTRALLAALADVRRSAYSRPVSDAIAYVRAHFSEPELSLNDVADSLHLSVGYLCMLFKQETGVTLKNHITDVRIEEAKRLLRTGHAKIYEICTAVGYPNSQYFSQVFYKKVGMYPAEYRRTGRDEA